jgi:regulator of replication initiation timing
LDNEAILKQFGEIEKKVDSLVKTNKYLESTNAELKEKIASLEVELHKKTELEERNSEVKTLIRSKIDSLMEKLDGVSETDA